jgi:hypothetical protein
LHPARPLIAFRIPVRVADPFPASLGISPPVLRPQPSCYGTCSTRPTP